MKKIILTIYTLFILSCPVFADVSYQVLAPIPNQDNVARDTIAINEGTLEAYFKNLYRLGIVIATGLAVLMIMWGGIEYITTDAMGGKEEAKERISSAIMGLLLALGSFVILRTIDPNLVSVKLDITGVDLSQVQSNVGEFKFPESKDYPLVPGQPGYGSVIGPDGQIINPTAQQGQTHQVRFTYYSSTEVNNDPDTMRGNGSFGPLVSNDGTYFTDGKYTPNPNVVGSAGSSYYPGGTIFSRNINANVVYNVVDDSNIKNGRPVNDLVSHPGAFDIYTKIPEDRWDIVLKDWQYSQPINVVYIPGTVADWSKGIRPKSFLSPAEIVALHDINNLRARIAGQ